MLGDECTPFSPEPGRWRERAPKSRPDGDYSLYILRKSGCVWNQYSKPFTLGCTA